MANKVTIYIIYPLRKKVNLVLSNFLSNMYLLKILRGSNTLKLRVNFSNTEFDHSCQLEGLCSPSSQMTKWVEVKAFLSRFVKSSYTLTRLTVTRGTKPKQPGFKLRALIFLCVLTLIRSSAFHGLTDGKKKQSAVKLLLTTNPQQLTTEKSVLTDFLRTGSVLDQKGETVSKSWGIPQK